MHVHLPRSTIYSSLLNPHSFSFTSTPLSLSNRCRQTDRMEITICSVSSSSVLVVVSVLVQILLCLGQDQKLASNGFISWDDLRVDEVMITEQNSTEAMIRTRVIVVDKNGTGNSVTVQGAIDMVPFNNINRVKILILPGIYRCFLLPESLNFRLQLLFLSLSLHIYIYMYVFMNLASVLVFSCFAERRLWFRARSHTYRS